MATKNTTSARLLQDFERYIQGNRNIFICLGIFLHNPGMMFSILYRIQRYLQFHTVFIFRLVGYVCYPMYFFLTYYIFSYHIEPDVEIEGGLYLHNRPIDITNATKIGRNVSIMGGVTIGTGFEHNHFDITIGDNVRIGTGAKIIAKGTLSITHDVTIGANSVVVKDIKSSGVYAGVPVKRIR